MPPGKPPVHLTPTKRGDIYDAISPLKGLHGSAKGLSVLITGAGRGIGRAQALAFAQAGATKITLVSLEEEELKEVKTTIASLVGLDDNRRVNIVKADITSEDQIAKAFDEAGSVDVLVNNAGRMNAEAKPHESACEDWWKTFEVNVKGTYVVAREAIRRALSVSSRPNLTIINTSSVASGNTRLGFSSYGSSKTAINRFTEFLHFEYEDSGIRVFAYHPGAIMTTLARDSMPANTFATLTDKPELSAGYCLWLATQGDRVDFLRGRWSSATWDVDELLELKQTILEKNLLWTRVVGQEQIM